MFAALLVTAAFGQCYGGSCAAPVAVYQSPVYASAPAYPGHTGTQAGYYYRSYSYPRYQPYYAPRRAAVFAPLRSRVMRSSPWGAGACYGGVCR